MQYRGGALPIALRQGHCGRHETYREDTDGVDRQLVQISVTHDGRI